MWLAMTVYDELLGAISNGDISEVEHLLNGGLDLNVPCDQGATPLFRAVFVGDLTLVRLLLEHGANPRFRADEPARTIYAETPMDLALQARTAVDCERYDSIVAILDEFGGSLR